MKSLTKTEMWIAIAMVFLMGLIHLYIAPGEYGEAPYLGIMFIVHSILSVVAAIGIYRGAQLWGWGLAIFLTAGAFAGYVISRTVGLPGMEVEEWGQPTGIAALILEAAFAMLILFELLKKKPSTSLSR